MKLAVSEAAERNKTAILHVLRLLMGFQSCKVLEIGSGTGQHAVHFARALSHVTWQPSDRDEYLPTLRARVTEAKIKNLLPPIELDVNAFPSVADVDVIFSANTLHIMSWDTGRQFICEAGARLPETGQLILYGPFNVGGWATSQSNAEFDASLRSRRAEMGIRDRERVCFEADRAGLSLTNVTAMPANNQLLAFERRAGFC